ncbi:gag-pol, partial [Mucuna pruriens]
VIASSRVGMVELKLRELSTFFRNMGQINFEIWVEAIATKTNDAKVVVNFLKSNIFCRFGVPKALISDEGSHFYNRAMSSILHKYRVAHRIATAYHP